MNSVNLIGRLTKEIELKQFQSNFSNGGAGCVLKNTLAVQVNKDKSIFIDFTAWNKTAELLAQYSAKGDKIAISGELECEEWRDKQTGQNRSKICVKATKCEFLAKSQNNSANNQGANGYLNQSIANHNVRGGATDNLGYSAQAQRQAPAQNDFIDPNEIPF